MSDSTAEKGSRGEDDLLRIDPHVKVLDERVVQRAVDAGLDALVYAPHFTRLPEIEREAEHYSTDELLVVPGREVFTGGYGDRKHVLAIGLSEPVPDFVDLDAAMAAFERQDATVLVPHPEFFTVGLEAADCREYRDVIDALEVHNPKHWPGHTRRAHELVEELDVPAYGSSYAHLPRTVGDVWTEFDASAVEAVVGETVVDGTDGEATADDGETTASDGEALASDSEATASDGGRSVTDEADGDGAASAGDRRPAVDDVAALLASGTGRVRRRNGVRAASRASAEFLHLFWENTAKKIDRVVLSGREPTHPTHPAYDGRFDDASVY